MALKNASTTIPAERSIGEIQRLLSRHKVREVSLRYLDGHPTAITFTVQTAHGLTAYLLPMDADAIQRTLAQQWMRREGVSRGQTQRGHAVDVGWRIIRDWVAAQLALIETGMALFDQVMLPYEIVRDGFTVYEEWLQYKQGLLDAPGGNRLALVEGQA